MICPMMSRPMKAHDGRNDYVEVHFVDCQKNKCALWISVRLNQGRDFSHCGLIKE